LRGMAEPKIVLLAASAKFVETETVLRMFAL
jgi:hypothetical protein